MMPNRLAIEALGARGASIFVCCAAFACCVAFACCASANERIKYLNKTGTSVNDSARLARSDTHTDSDKGEKRYFAVPCNRKMGTKTMQMQRVDNIVGTPTSPAPATMATSK